MGAAYYSARRYAEAIALWQRAPDAIPEVRAYLAAACILAERPEEARRHMAEFLRCYPLHWAGQPNLRAFAAQFSWKREEDTNLLIDTLRQAGLPD